MRGHVHKQLIARFQGAADFIEPLRNIIAARRTSDIRNLVGSIPVAQVFRLAKHLRQQQVGTRDIQFGIFKLNVPRSVVAIAEEQVMSNSARVLLLEKLLKEHDVSFQGNLISCRRITTADGEEVIVRQTSPGDR